MMSWPGGWQAWHQVIGLPQRFADSGNLASDRPVVVVVDGLLASSLVSVFYFFNFCFFGA